MKYLLAFIILCANLVSFAQNDFPYRVALRQIDFAAAPALHSYAFAQHNGKWLLVGGRTDGIHARQPFNAFPASNNNTNMYVLDVVTKQVWSASISTLPLPIAEQLQSTNMNFHQVADTLYIAGGYAYSTSANAYITFPKLTTINVPATIQAIINNTSMSAFIKQAEDTVFAVTGGHLAALDGMFYLVGGHRFDGRYNPMGPTHGPGFTQTYTDQVRKFKINNSGAAPIKSQYSVYTDPVHLHRRDYNLLPQIFPNGQMGFTISAGVFQIGADLPFLYPVDITAGGYTPITSFSQYLSHYHSAVAPLYDSAQNRMHNLFFGGISQYYYNNGTLVKDDGVPFVKTISRVSRWSNGSLYEYKMDDALTDFRGASAEFIFKESIPHYTNEVIKLNHLSADTNIIGHIYGGLYSPTMHAFNNNNTGTTSAVNTIYEVLLIKDKTAKVETIDGSNPYTFKVFPNPVQDFLNIAYTVTRPCKIDYWLHTAQGQLLKRFSSEIETAGSYNQKLDLRPFAKTKSIMLNIVVDDKFYSVHQLQVE